MDWNHRVVRVTSGDETYLMLAEVFYNDDGMPSGYSECFMIGDDLGELRQLVNRLADAVTHPILDEKDMKRIPAPDDLENDSVALDKMAEALGVELRKAITGKTTKDNARMSVPGGWLPGDECPLCGNAETCKECK